MSVCLCCFSHFLSFSFSFSFSCIWEADGGDLQISLFIYMYSVEKIDLISFTLDTFPFDNQIIPLVQLYNGNRICIYVCMYVCIVYIFRKTIQSSQSHKYFPFWVCMSVREYMRVWLLSRDNINKNTLIEQMIHTPRKIYL